MCVLCCAALGVWGAARASIRPIAYPPASLADAAIPHRSTVEFAPTGLAYRWLGTGYPLALAGAHGAGVLRARIWVARDVTTAALATPNGLIPLPRAVRAPARVVAIYLHHIPWWQQGVVRVVATPGREPQAVVAYAGLVWQPRMDQSLWVGGIWVLALASIGWARRNGPLAAGLSFVALVLVWSWPAAIA